MKVKECMNPEPLFIGPEASLQEAAQWMKKHDIGFLPVGENDRLIGVLTDRDIVTRAVAENKSLTKTTVRDCMSKRVYYCYENSDLKEASDNMCELQIRRLIVLNDDKRMRGILSFQNVGRSHDEELCGHLLEEVTELRRAA